MRYLMMLLILCGSVAVSASPIESLSRLLEPYRTFSADFTQRTLDQDNTPISQMTGQLAIASASVFYWKTDPPFAQSVIADAILFGNLSGGGSVLVTVDSNDELAFEMTPREVKSKETA